MYQLQITSKFKKDIKRLKGGPKDHELAKAVPKRLSQQGVKGIPAQMHPHKLSGTYKNCWECHIKPHLLIIWIHIDKNNIIKLVRLGPHSELFK